MERRRIIAAMLAMFMLASLCACGGGHAVPDESEETAETDKMESFKVGIVQYTSDTVSDEIRENLQRELYEQGRDRSVRFDFKKYAESANGDREILDVIGEELVELEVDCIIAIGEMAAKRMKICTKGSDIPVVFASVSDPEGSGLISDAKHPEGNVTGVATEPDTRKILELMLAADSDLETVGLLYSGNSDSSRTAAEEAKSFFHSKGIEPIEQTGTDNDTLWSAASQLVDEGVDAVFTPGDETALGAEQSVYQLFIDAGIPQYCGGREFAAGGAFLGYGADNAELGIATAQFVAEMLADMREVSEMPVRYFSQGVAVINTETAESIGVNTASVRKLFKPICGEVRTTKTKLDQVPAEEE